MDTITRRSAAKRHAAIERHRSLTSTVAAAGGIATIGFAALAAVTFRGNAATSLATTTSTARDGIVQSEVRDDESFVNSGTTTPRLTAPNVSGSTRAAGPAHATTGGS